MLTKSAVTLYQAAKKGTEPSSPNIKDIDDDDDDEAPPPVVAPRPEHTKSVCHLPDVGLTA